MPRRRPELAALDRARTYSEWHAAAEALDRIEGNDRWRADEAHPDLDTELLRRHVDSLEALRRAGDLFTLSRQLHESLHRHLGELANPALYERARLGTKHIVERYLAEVESGIDAIADTEIPGVPTAEKLRLLELAAHNLGRTALMLSGGATMGLFHAGVVKALWSQDLLPRVLSGASTGAIIAAATCTRTDAELAAVFSDPSSIDTRVFRRLSPRRILRGEGLMDPENLLRSIRANIPDLTFREAYERTGRILNIAISPTRARQKPRLLNHGTAPDVLIPRAVLASSAIPWVFPPASLVARDERGRELPYVPDERWIDGTIHSDLPMHRISRLLNVNHFIVSQTNPHLVPMLRVRRGHGPGALLADAALSSVQGQGLQMLGVLRRHATSGGMARVVDALHGALDQRSGGDIDIHPPLELWNYRKVFANASAGDFERFILQGERATWPRIPMIRDQTRVSCTLERAIERLRSGQDA